MVLSLPKIISQYCELVKLPYVIVIVAVGLQVFWDTVEQKLGIGRVKEVEWKWLHT